MVGPVLVAGEDHRKRAELSTMLRGFGYRVIEAENSLRTIDLLYRRKNIMLILLDITMSDLSVSDLIKMIRTVGISAPIIVIAKQDTQELIQNALNAGAIDYWIYPVTPMRLRVTLNNLALITALESEVQSIRRQKENHLQFSDIYKKSSVMQVILEQSKSAATSFQNLLIEGEVGTGREKLARIIHHEGFFSKGAFVRFQCLPVFDSEEENRFWFEEFLPLVFSLEHGTLCLCDIDRLEPIQQKRFAHYLKERAEATKGTNPPFRIIALSTSRLADLVQEGFFIHSFFEQISQLYINIPSLRELRDDLPEISQCLIDHIITETGRSHVHGLAGAVISMFMQYDWPGNYRELENLLFRAVLMSEGPLLTVQDFPQLIKNPLMIVSKMIDHDIQERYEKKFIQFFNADGHVRTFSEMERDIIEKAVAHYKGRMSEIARRLQIGRSTLYRKIEELKTINNQKQ
ncbi:sigma factor-dependent DNA-binding response regulator [Bartonella clarridgeiae 73]|uniref:DNA-binding transcriptional regulator NtrC n=1 Tax=Bartonella clarridgeiae (strain CCUG 45776 / CIP 104772 / 73) TaxID=696125 RepID=E6YIT5_BARC7|nr:sigma 54-interacting transcriptional regulator [Bartonella clarridgeiae]WCR54661.1 MAG: Two component sigma-54-dependent transcriptional regulator Fis family [Bartonella clarridgeiae]CBI76773.1 sigma factor-dependent DNA-binding response regulator [Bartonella clarridgeiae 73]